MIQHSPCTELVEYSKEKVIQNSFYLWAIRPVKQNKRNKLKIFNQIK